jgi:hypothetical protein
VTWWMLGLSLRGGGSVSTTRTQVQIIG